MHNAFCRRFLTVALAALLVTAGFARAEQASPNASAYANALAAANGIPNFQWPNSWGLSGLATMDQETVLYNNSTAEVYASAMQTSLSTQRIFRDTLPSVADYSQTAHRQAPEENCGLVPGSICAPGNKWVMWDTPWMQSDTQKRKDGYLGYDYQSSGFATGLTRLIGEKSAIGIAVGYDYRYQEGRDGYFQKVKGDAFHTAIYGGTAIGCTFIDAYAGFSWTSQRSRRLSFDGTVDQSGNYNDRIFSAGVKASQVFVVGNDIRITPAIGLDFSRINVGDITEKNNYYNRLRVVGDDYNSVQMPVTVAVNKTFASDFLNFGGVCSLWTPEVRGGWVPQFGSKQSSVKAFDYTSASQAFQFESKSAKLSSSYGTVGAGLKIQIKDKFIFALDYDYRFASKYDSHVITGTYGVCF